MTKLETLTTNVNTALADLEVGAKLFDGTIYAGHASTLRTFAQTIRGNVFDQMTNAAAALDAQATPPPVVTPPPTGAWPTAASFGLTSIRRVKISSFPVPAPGRIFSNQFSPPGPFKVKDGLVVEFIAPPHDSRNQLGITHSGGATGPSRQRDFTLSTHPADFNGDHAITDTLGRKISKIAGNVMSMRLDATLGLTPGNTYYFMVTQHPGDSYPDADIFVSGN